MEQHKNLTTTRRNIYRTLPPMHTQISTHMHIVQSTFPRLSVFSGPCFVASFLTKNAVRLCLQTHRARWGGRGTCSRHNAASSTSCGCRLGSSSARAYNPAQRRVLSGTETDALPPGRLPCHGHVSRVLCRVAGLRDPQRQPCKTHSMAMAH